LSFLYQFKPKVFNSISDGLLADIGQFLRGIVPLTADMSVEDIIMGKVDIQVIVKSNKFIS
jgi:hypothetical protein